MSEKPSIQQWAESKEVIGHKAEDHLETFLRKYAKLGLIKEVKEEDFGTDLPTVSFFRTTEKTDQVRGYDFGFYNGYKWLRSDLTTLMDLDLIDKKAERNKERGIETLYIPYNILEKAAASTATLEDPNEFQLRVSKALDEHMMGGKPA